MPEPEIGWYDIEIAEAGAADPVVGSARPFNEPLEWHHYAAPLPPGAVSSRGRPRAAGVSHRGEARMGPAIPRRGDAREPVQLAGRVGSGGGAQTDLDPERSAPRANYASRNRTRWGANSRSDSWPKPPEIGPCRTYARIGHNYDTISREGRTRCLRCLSSARRAAAVPRAEAARLRPGRRCGRGPPASAPAAAGRPARRDLPAGARAQHRLAPHRLQLEEQHRCGERRERGDQDAHDQVADRVADERVRHAVRDRVQHRRDHELDEEQDDDHAEDLPAVPAHQLAAAAEGVDRAAGARSRSRARAPPRS